MPRWVLVCEYQRCYRLNQFLVVRLAKEVVRSFGHGSQTYVRVQIILMTEQDWNTHEKKRDESPRPAKRQYQEPAFRHERVFETMALSCGKTSSTQFQCRFHRNAS
jgi:hypothetical protein